MGIMGSMFSGAAGFALGAGLMLSPRSTRFRRRALKGADSLKRALMKR